VKAAFGRRQAPRYALETARYRANDAKKFDRLLYLIVLSRRFAENQYPLFRTSLKAF
jgi:hypothetical protein